MANAEDRRAERRRRFNETQNKARAVGRLCGWCESPDDVEIIQWHGKAPEEGKEAKKPLLIPIGRECKARLDTIWPDGTALCGFCEMPTKNTTNWRGPSGPFVIVICEACDDKLSVRWQPQANVCGHCGMPTIERIKWRGIPYRLPICSECKARLTGSLGQREESLWRRFYSWLMGT